MKRITAIILLVGLLFALTACGKVTGDKVTLYEGNALKIEREGAITRIYDLAGNAEYSFTAHRTRAKKGTEDIVKTANTTTTTDTINIKTVHGIIIVTTADGETLYIK